MLIFDAIAIATGLFLIWTGATDRNTVLMTDPETGADYASGIGNGLAIAAGACVVLAVLT